MPILNPSATNGLTNINLLQPTAFKLVIDRRNYQNIEFFAQTVQIPAISLSAAPQYAPRQGPGIPFPGDKLTFSELTATMLIDEELNGYIEMYRWMERLVETNYISPYNKTDTELPHHADVTVTILTSHNNANRQFRFIDCIPTSLGDISMEASTQDTVALVSPISFAYSYFTID